MTRDKRLLSATLLLLVAVVVGVFSYNNAWIGDELRYMFDFSDADRSEVVRSLGDVIASQNAHYFLVNGRYVAHVIVQCFCGMWGHLPFAVANAAAYICFCLILFRLCHVRLSNFKAVATVVLLSLLTFQTKMVPSCQVGYIWMFTLTMVFLYLFFRTDYDYKRWMLIPLAVFCMIAGNGQEALNLGVSGALIIYWCNLHLLYPGKPDLRIVPERLKGCGKKDLGNRLYETRRDGVYLAVQSKTNPARLYVRRRMRWPLTAKTFPPGEVDFSPENVVAEGEKWIARYVDAEEYTILNLSRQMPEFESDKKEKE